MNTYETIVGLEIHVELKTVSKMFCGCRNDPFGAPKPNIYTCPVCLGLPGALPVPNKKAIEWTIMLGLALGAKIPLLSKFDRKNYFYPDIPKGYQISQYDEPMCLGGLIKTKVGNVRIHRVHLEEDTGKLMHAAVDGKNVSLVDFNRSGVPLIEIVTEADIRSGEQAKAFLHALHQIIQYVGVSDADMEKGSMRIEPNISVRIVGQKEMPSYKVEVKNINSFNFVKKAIEFETNRHIALLEKGQTPVQETRGWDEQKNETVSQRRKETADDYRYFPDPDIPPLRWTKEHIETLRKLLPELPDAKKRRFISAWGISEPQAIGLTESVARADFFERAAEASKNQKLAGAIANLIINKKADEHSTPEELVKEIQEQVERKTVDPQVISSAVDAVLAEQTSAVADYKSGKTAAANMLLGMVLKKLQGRGDAQKVRELLLQKLS